MIWALLGEGAATRSKVAGLRTDFAAALDGTRDALLRVEALLALDTRRGEDLLDLRQALAWANGGILAEKIVPEDARSYRDIEFPTVGESYVNPRYRMAPARDRARTAGRQSEESPRPADEHWWDDLPSHDDFDLMLAAYITSPDATRLPMLLLGHPGGGKSMLTKVFAARLPASAYTVVRVPLRRVGANAPLVNQIERALHEATNGRVDSWWRLAEQSADTDRVVLLDGLDELLQASQADRSGYLQEVMEFQRLEAEQHRPVVVVVTSRTVVADRVDIPRGTAVVKLDMFEESDIADWLDRWRKANATAIMSGMVRALTVDALIGGTARGPRDGQGTDPGDDGIRESSILELARQPLLLLILALYAADPALPPLDADLATADLYQRLLESFSRREAAKALGPNTRPGDLDDQVQDHLERLAIAALAMFNRGRQDISEKELGADLDALDPRLKERSQSVEAGQRIIAEFFFVHAAEARPLTGPVELEAATAGQSSLREPPRRSYEFLHATFGEYLVAYRVISELVDVAAKAFAGRRGSADPDDDLLYALLSHQVLAARKSTLNFAEEIFNSIQGKDREHVLDVLEILLASYRRRHSSNRYASYRPMPPDEVRELACYSANLVALRATLEQDSGSVPLAKLLRTPHNALDKWRSTVMLWKCALDGDGMQSMLGTVKLSVDPPSIHTGAERPVSLMYSSDDPILAGNEISLARLAGDRAMEKRLKYGIAATDGYAYAYDNSEWMHVMASWLIPAIAGKRTGHIISEPPEGTSPRDIKIVAGLIFQCLRDPRGDANLVGELLGLLFRLPPVFDIDCLT
ncbi:MAG: NACHT domain-containing protein, partial [Candidatus Binataceae bacterium]